MTKRISGWLGIDSKMQEEALGNDGSFCYLDRGGGYMGINIYQNSELQCSHLMTQLAHF